MEWWWFLGALVFLWVGYLIGRTIGAARAIPAEREARADAVKRSRSVIGGQVSEQLAPYFPDFPGKPSEARFIGKPVDFIVFDGLDEKQITGIRFVEVKTGKSGLSAVERSLRDIITDGKVSWAEYRLTHEKR